MFVHGAYSIYGVLVPSPDAGFNSGDTFLKNTSFAATRRHLNKDGEGEGGGGGQREGLSGNIFFF